MKTNSKTKLISSMIIFGTIGIFVRYITLPSSVIALVRGFVGTAFLLAFVRIKGSRLSFADIKRNGALLVVSGIFIGINWILLFEAYRYTTVATATLCYYLAPVFVILASPVFLKEKLTPKKFGCVLVALAGMFLVSGVVQNGGIGSSDLKGILCGTGAAAFYAGVILMNKKLKEIGSFDITIVQLGTAAIVLLPYTIFTENFLGLSASAAEIGLLFVVGIVHTGIAYVLYFSSMKDLKAQTVALFSYIDPVVAIVLSAVLLREKMDLLSAVGAVMVLGSTLASEFVEKREQ